MSVFRVTMEVQQASGGGCEPLEVLVDIGATWTWIPRDILARLGYTPTLKRSLRTADNRIIERDAGWIQLRIGQETSPSLCIFGDEGSEVLPGAFTLEGFSLAPDPVNERLVPVVGMLMTLLE